MMRSKLRKERIIYLSSCAGRLLTRVTVILASQAAATARCENVS